MKPKAVMPFLTAAICGILVLMSVSSCSGQPGKGDADKLFAQGRYDEAVELYQDLLAKKPDDKALSDKLADAKERAAAQHLSKGQTALAQNRLMDARAEYADAVKYNPDSPEAKQGYAEAAKLLESVEAGISGAKALAAQGKWAEAVEKITPLRKYDRNFPEIEPLYGSVSDEAFKSAMKEGTDAYDSGDYSGALLLFTRAQSYRPDDQRAHGMLEDTRKQITVRQMCDNGDALLVKGSWRQAMQQYDGALGIMAGNRRATGGVKAAKEYGVKALMAEADALLEAGKLPEAVVTLDGAANLLPDYPGLAAARTKARRALADLDFALGEKQEKAGHLAAALAYYKLVKLLVPTYPKLWEKIAAGDKSIEGSTAYDAVISFKAGAGLEARIVKELQDELSSGKVTVLTQARLDAIKKVSPEFKPDGVLEVSVGAAKVSYGTPKVETRSLRYVKETRLVDNPDYLDLRDRVDRDSAKVLDLRRSVDNQERVVRDLARARDIAYDEWNATPGNDPRKDELYRRYLRLRDAAREEQSRLDAFERLYDDWTYQLHTDESRLAQTPRQVEQKVYADYSYDVTTRRVTAQQESRFTLQDQLPGAELQLESVKAEQYAEDMSWKAFGPAGLAAKSEELPSDGEMRGQVEDETLSDLPAALAAALNKYPERFLRAAEVAEKAGDADLALEYYARYDFVCKQLGLRNMSRMGQVETLIKQKMGYSPLWDTYDLEMIREK
jgi:hypothetical protein